MKLTRLGSLAGIALVALAFAACSPSQLRTAPAPATACELALMAGSLERHPQTGLGIAGSDVDLTPVQWPFGYSARTELSTIVLVDESGKVVAREHDRVEVGGGLGNDGVWFACGPVRFVDNTGG